MVVVESDYYVKIDEGKELDEGDIDKLFQTPQYYTTSEWYTNKGINLILSTLTKSL